MHPISIEEFAEMTVKANQDMNKKVLIKALRQALEDKNNGARCMIAMLIETEKSPGLLKYPMLKL